MAFFVPGIRAIKIKNHHIRNRYDDFFCLFLCKFQSCGILSIQFTASNCYFYSRLCVAYSGLSNKALAEKCGFDASCIGRGIKLGSFPSVETALKIARALNVSVEYLTGDSKETSDSKSPQNLGRKYYNTLRQLDSLPEKQRNSIIHMIEEMS